MQKEKNDINCLLPWGNRGEWKDRTEKGQTEKGRTEKGWTDTGQTEKGRTEKGRTEKGRTEKGRMEKRWILESRAKTCWDFGLA